MNSVTRSGQSVENSDSSDEEQELDVGEEDTLDEWKNSVRMKLKMELEQRVRDALDTPPLERIMKRKQKLRYKHDREQYIERLRELNDRICRDLTTKEGESINTKAWRRTRRKRLQMLLDAQSGSAGDWILRLGKKSRKPKGSNRSSEVEGSEVGDKATTDDETTTESIDNYSRHQRHRAELRQYIRSQLRQEEPKISLAVHAHTRHGFIDAMEQRMLKKTPRGRYEDHYGVQRTLEGPFWPDEITPLLPTPSFLIGSEPAYEPLVRTSTGGSSSITSNGVTTGKEARADRWPEAVIVFDKDKTSRNHIPHPVPEDCVPNLCFESRFESGNLRQARRIGQTTYELVLSADLYTMHHTQWYYFRVSNMMPGLTYKFIIVNFLKRDSLYANGMQPLVYSNICAERERIGWKRVGKNISYSKNMDHLNCQYLSDHLAYYALEFEMEFPYQGDICYLAHCYPYTFTDLRNDLTNLNEKYRSNTMRIDQLCQTRGGNTCYVITITDFAHRDKSKLSVLLTARVHPGETGASWIIRGVIKYLSSSHHIAEQLRRKFVFKIVPMLNPDGVIIGNYRCSLAARDLNRNYRHPRQSSFPTVFSVKQLIENMLTSYPVLLYCDIHGHSRKLNTFMYGCNSELEPDVATRSFLNERLFPWLLSQKIPEFFSFNSCKYHIRKCKEATGRVVVWRQYGIMNSYTLESSFAGSSLTSQPFHYNTSHYEAMGRALCDALLQYHSFQYDSVKQPQILVDISRMMTSQVIESRKLTVGTLLMMVPPDTQCDGSSYEICEMLQTGSAEQLSSTLLSILKQALTRSKRERDYTIEDETALNSFERTKAERITKAETVRTLLDRLAIEAPINRMLSNLRLPTIADAADSSSNSSDSDSESNPEEQNASLTKKSSKKNKRKTKQSKKKSVDRSSKSDIQNDDVSSMHSRRGAVSVQENSVDSKQKEKQIYYPPRTSSQPTRKPTVTYAPFVSKYEGRHNSGIPCFTHERNVERTAKRMEELQQKMEDQRRRELAEYVNCPLLSEDIRTRLRHILQESLHVQHSNSGTHYSSDEIQSLTTPSQQSDHNQQKFRLGYTHGDVKTVTRMPSILIQSAGSGSSRSADQNTSRKSSATEFPHGSQQVVDIPQQENDTYNNDEEITIHSLISRLPNTPKATMRYNTTFNNAPAPGLMRSKSHIVIPQSYASLDKANRTMVVQHGLHGAMRSNFMDKLETKKTQTRVDC